MTAAEALRAAMALIEDESRWCQVAYARAANGRALGVGSDEATQWCASSALWETVDHPIEAFSLLYDAAKALYGASLPYVNDHFGHAAVMECYREAIRRAEAQS